MQNVRQMDGEKQSETVLVPNKAAAVVGRTDLFKTFQETNGSGGGGGHVFGRQCVDNSAAQPFNNPLNGTFNNAKPVSVTSCCFLTLKHKAAKV